MKLTSRAVLVGAATLLALLMWLLAGSLRPQPAYACTGSIEDLSLDYFTRQADAIALVDVSEVGRPENEAPPLPPGTPLRSGAGPGSVPQDFHFAGYRATATIRQTIAGSIAGQVVIDEAVRAEMETIVRRWEAGERYVPCFFGMQDRYEAGASYLVFLAQKDKGWQTLEAYKVVDGILTLGSQSGAGWPDRLLLSETFYRRFLLDLPAKDVGGGFQNTYGTLWQVESERVPLAPALAAIESIRSTSVVKPPNTGDAGLR